MKDRGNILDKKIEHFIEANKAKYCFKIGNYDIPEVLITNNRNRINLKKNRQALIRGSNSPYSINMENYLKSQNIDCIKEMVVIIQDYNLWEDIINFLNPSQEDRINCLGKNYFSLDFFIPDKLICIEVDSDFHNDRKILDQARDYYISSTFSIDTLRFYHFGDNNVRDRENIAVLNYKLSQYPRRNPETIFNYTDVLISNFKYEKEYLLIMLDRLKTFVGNLAIAKNISITEKDYNNLATGINFGNLTTPMMFSNDFIELTEDLFNCKVNICKGVVNYSIVDICYVLRTKNIPIQSDIISKYGFIPYWIYKIINIPKEYWGFISQSCREDELILKYIQDGKIR